jgi:hypothetical protein
VHTNRNGGAICDTLCLCPSLASRSWSKVNELCDQRINYNQRDFNNLNLFKCLNLLKRVSRSSSTCSSSSRSSSPPRPPRCPSGLSSKAKASSGIGHVFLISYIYIPLHLLINVSLNFRMFERLNRDTGKTSLSAILTSSLGISQVRALPPPFFLSSRSSQWKLLPHSLSFPPSHERVACFFLNLYMFDSRCVALALTTDLTSRLFSSVSEPLSLEPLL